MRNINTGPEDSTGVCQELRSPPSSCKRFGFRGSHECTAAAATRIKNSSLCSRLHNGPQPNSVNREKFKLGAWCAGALPLISLCVSQYVSRASQQSLQLGILLGPGPVPNPDRTTHFRAGAGRAEALYGGAKGPAGLLPRRAQRSADEA